MSEVNHNFIAGEWLAGASEIANINPSDIWQAEGRYMCPIVIEAGAGLTDND